MEKLGATLATKYGNVTEGKHKGNQVALGNDPSNKVTTVDKFTQIIFLDGKETTGRYNIGSEATMLHYVDSTDDIVTVSLDFADGESCTIELTTPKDDKFIVALLKKQIGLKSNTQINSDGTTEQNNDNKYHHIRTFIFTFVDHIDKESEQKFIAFLKAHNMWDAKK